MRMRWILVAYTGCMLCLAASNARAEFLISSAILEFTQDGARQQDIELVSRGGETDYIVTEVNEIVGPGTPQEAHQRIEEPADGWLLVTPDKTVLAAGSRKVLRFVLLREPDEAEHIYRVAVKPVVSEVKNPAKVGLKVLIGYEALVIIRPAVVMPRYDITRNGKTLTVANRGNSNVLLQSGTQCEERAACPLPPVVRAYAGQTARIELPRDAPVTYSVWDGKEIRTVTF